MGHKGGGGVKNPVLPIRIRKFFMDPDQGIIVPAPAKSERVDN